MGSQVPVHTERHDATNCIAAPLLSAAYSSGFKYHSSPAERKHFWNTTSIKLAWLYHSL